MSATARDVATIPDAHPWRRVAVRVAVSLASVVLLLMSIIAVRSYVTMSRLMFSPMHGAVDTADANRLLPDRLDVTFQSRIGDTLSGWYLPSRNRAAIVLCHGSGADRRQMIHEAALLHARGFGVLLFDWPGHGESEGKTQWHMPERNGLFASVDFLSKRPDVDATRIGAMGFSMGGYVLAQVVVKEPRIAAVALAGTPHDIARQTRWEYRRWGLLSQTGALAALAGHGLPLDAPAPMELVAGIAPRPLLVIGGTHDEIVLPTMAEALYDSAREPKELLLVSRAGHGGYVAKGGASYATTLGSFFERALLR